MRSSTLRIRRRRSFRPAARDIAFLQYTSGSTGSPKGVVLTHANLLANIRAMGRAAGVLPNDVFVSWLPLYHDMGLIGAWLGTLYHGVPLVVMSPTDFLGRPESWLWAMHRHRGTLSGAPNFAYEICATRLDDSRLAGLDLSSWRVAYNGSEPVSPDTVVRFNRRFAAYGFDPRAQAPVYGLAESAVGLTFPPLDRGVLIDRVDRRQLAIAGDGTSGARGRCERAAHRLLRAPPAGHEIRVVDAAGQECPERREGRIEFRGPSATSGYFRNPEATRRLFDDGWLDTGDLGYLAGGELYVTGRAKDIIIRGGQHIHPQEAEAAIGNLPGIRKGCVTLFGAPDPASGTEKVVVLAETRESDPDRKEALAILRGRAHHRAARRASRRRRAGPAAQRAEDLERKDSARRLQRALSPRNDGRRSRARCGRRCCASRGPGRSAGRAAAWPACATPRSASMRDCCSPWPCPSRSRWRRCCRASRGGGTRQRRSPAHSSAHRVCPCRSAAPGISRPPDR